MELSGLIGGTEDNCPINEIVETLTKVSYNPVYLHQGNVF